MLAEEIEELGRADSVVVVSFDDDVIAAFHEFAPDIPTSPGTSALDRLVPRGRAAAREPSRAPGAAAVRRPRRLDPARLPREGRARRASGSGCGPNDASTQENADFYESLLDFDIDGLIAGHPELAVERWREIGAIP